VLTPTMSLDAALRELATERRIRVGMELVDAPRVSLDSKAVLDVVRGASTFNAFDRLLRTAAPKYDFVEDRDGVIVVRSRNQPQNQQSWLNQIIPTFAVKDTAVREALYAVFRLFDPEYPTRPLPPRFQLDLARSPARQADIMQPITVSLKQATVWQILNAIIVAHGGLGWRVTYAHGQRVAEEARIQVFSWDGWAMSFGARPLKFRGRPHPRR
jgi:hypothetical protein